MTDFFASIHPPAEVSFHGRCSSPSDHLHEDHDYSPLSSPNISPLPVDDTLREEDEKDNIKLVATTIPTPRSLVPFDEGTPARKNSPPAAAKITPGLHLPRAEDLSKLLPPRIRAVVSRDSSSPVLIKPTWKAYAPLVENRTAEDEKATTTTTVLKTPIAADKFRATGRDDDLPDDELAAVALVTPTMTPPHNPEDWEPADLAMAPTDEKCMMVRAVGSGSSGSSSSSTGGDDLVDDLVISTVPTDERGIFRGAGQPWRTPSRDEIFQTMTENSGDRSPEEGLKEPAEIVIRGGAIKSLPLDFEPASEKAAPINEPPKIPFERNEETDPVKEVSEMISAEKETLKVTVHMEGKEVSRNDLAKSIHNEVTKVVITDTPTEVRVQATGSSTLSEEHERQTVRAPVATPSQTQIQHAPTMMVEEEDEPGEIYTEPARIRMVPSAQVEELCPHENEKNISTDTPSSPFVPNNFSFEDSPMDEIAANSTSSSVDSVRQDETPRHLGAVKRSFVNEIPLDETEPTTASRETSPGETHSPEAPMDENPPNSSFLSWGDVPPPTWTEPAPLKEKRCSEPPVLSRLNPSSCSSSVQDASSLSNFGLAAVGLPEEEPPSLSRSEHSLAAQDSLSRKSEPRMVKGRDPEASYDGNKYDEANSCSTNGLIDDLQCMVQDLDESIRQKSPASSPTKSRATTIPSPTDHHPRDPEPIQDGLPVLINPLNNDIGIPKGDIMISLLHDDDEERTWARRVYESTWRCRTARRNCDTAWLRGKIARHSGQPGLGRSSVLVDADNGRVSTSVEATQSAAIQHLKYDELSDALDLYEDILQRYQGFSEKELMEDYVGLALYNLGIVHMLRGDFENAYRSFDEAQTKTVNTKRVDRLSLSSKMAICLFALGDLVTAKQRLREALVLARSRKSSLPDRRQNAEIMNNLACLCYTLNEPKEALGLFRESLEIQLTVSEDSLYLGSKFSYHASSLNIAVVRANLGFLSLVARDLPTARLAFESAIKAQSLLLRDAHITLVSTMDHLAVVHLLANNTEKALQLLRRVYHMQIDAFGPKDRRCQLTGNKIRMIEGKEGPEKLEAALAAIPSLGQKREEVEQRGKKPVTLLRAFNPMRKWGKP